MEDGRVVGGDIDAWNQHTCCGDLKMAFRSLLDLTNTGLNHMISDEIRYHIVLIMWLKREYAIISIRYYRAGLILVVKRVVFDNHNILMLAKLSISRNVIYCMTYFSSGVCIENYLKEYTVGKLVCKSFDKQDYKDQNWKVWMNFSNTYVL